VVPSKPMRHLGGQRPGVCETRMMTDVRWRDDLA
jgi:hypothetical protein